MAELHQGSDHSPQRQAQQLCLRDKEKNKHTGSLQSIDVSVLPCRCEENHNQGKLEEETFN